jgi:hypothetical protein
MFQRQSDEGQADRKQIAPLNASHLLHQMNNPIAISYHIRAMLVSQGCPYFMMPMAELVNVFWHEGSM